MKRLRVFLAEDNRHDVRLVEESLREAGVPYELSVHQDGLDAIQAFDELGTGDHPCPDLVLLDINLPRKDGFDILSHIRRSDRCPTVPVAMVTSSDLPEDRGRASDLGANAYVNKSIDIEEFMSSLTRLLNKLIQNP